MDSSFIIYDDISLNDELLRDFELCGDNSCVWQFETEDQDFLQTVTSVSNNFIEDSREATQNENQEFFQSDTSNSIENSNTVLLPKCDDRHFSRTTVSPTRPRTEETVSPTHSRTDGKKIGFECSLCGKHFAQKSSCNRHKREQHLQPERFHCNICGLRFSKKFNLQTHQKRVHPNRANNGLKCPHCSRVYSKVAAVKKHIIDCQQKEQLIQKGTTIHSQPVEDNNPQLDAENVLKQLLLLQKDIEGATKQTTDEFCNTTNDIPAEEITSIDESAVEVVTIIDRLYPFGEVKELKVQQIKRDDGLRYLVCEFCSKEFRKSYGYLRHRRIHCRIRPFICVLCKKAFPTKNQLKRHCSTHKLSVKFGIHKGFYKCPKCFENIATITQFDSHLSSHLPHSVITFKCRTCNKSFNSLNTFFRHKHKADDPELNMLKYLLPSPIYLVDGEKVISVCDIDTGESHQCSLCCLKMSSCVALKQHEKRHRHLRKYQCFLCNGYYASQSSLEVHLKIHLNQRNFKCTKCSKVFRTNFQLKRHGLRHTSIKTYKCSYCNQVFKIAQYCRSHMMTHLKKLIKTNGELQQQKENLTSVQTLIENNDKTEIVITEMHVLKNKQSSRKCPKNDSKTLSYKCLKCPLKFRYNSWLKKHIAQTHSDERPFKCEICLKTFRKNQVLQTHLLTHQDVRTKETCVVCGKKYTSNKSLKIHLRLHTEERPFKCEICKKSFRTSGHLIQHRKSNHKDVCK